MNIEHINDMIKAAGTEIASLNDESSMNYESRLAVGNIFISMKTFQTDAEIKGLKGEIEQLRTEISDFEPVRNISPEDYNEVKQQYAELRTSYLSDREQLIRSMSIHDRNLYFKLSGELIKSGNLQENRHTIEAIEDKSGLTKLKSDYIDQQKVISSKCLHLSGDYKVFDRIKAECSLEEKETRLSIKESAIEKIADVKALNEKLHEIESKLSDAKAAGEKLPQLEKQYGELKSQYLKMLRSTSKSTAVGTIRVIGSLHHAMTSVVTAIKDPTPKNVLHAYKVLRGVASNIAMPVERILLDAIPDIEDKNEDDPEIDESDREKPDDEVQEDQKEDSSSDEEKEIKEDAELIEKEAVVVPAEEMSADDSEDTEKPEDTETEEKEDPSSDTDEGSDKEETDDREKTENEDEKGDSDSEEDNDENESEEDEESEDESDDSDIDNEDEQEDEADIDSEDTEDDESDEDSEENEEQETEQEDSYEDNEDEVEQDDEEEFEPEADIDIEQDEDIDKENEAEEQEAPDEQEENEADQDNDTENETDKEDIKEDNEQSEEEKEESDDKEEESEEPDTENDDEESPDSEEPEDDEDTDDSEDEAENEEEQANEDESDKSDEDDIDEEEEFSEEDDDSAEDESDEEDDSSPDEVDTEQETDSFDGLDTFDSDSIPDVETSGDFDAESQETEEIGDSNDSFTAEEVIDTLGDIGDIISGKQDIWDKAVSIAKGEIKSFAKEAASELLGAGMPEITIAEKVAEVGAGIFVLSSYADNMQSKAENNDVPDSVTTVDPANIPSQETFESVLADDVTKFCDGAENASIHDIEAAESDLNADDFMAEVIKDDSRYEMSQENFDKGIDSYSSVEYTYTAPEMAIDAESYADEGLGAVDSDLDFNTTEFTPDIPAYEGEISVNANSDWIDAVHDARESLEDTLADVISSGFESIGISEAEFGDFCFKVDEAMESIGIKDAMDGIGDFFVEMNDCWRDEMHSEMENVHEDLADIGEGLDYAAEDIAENGFLSSVWDAWKTGMGF